MSYFNRNQRWIGFAEDDAYSPKAQVSGVEAAFILPTRLTSRSDDLQRVERQRAVFLRIARF
jgi:hypothetical protein